jgi:hypothetical protein
MVGISISSTKEKALNSEKHTQFDIKITRISTEFVL